MKLDMSMLDGKAACRHAEVEVPILSGADLDSGLFALPMVQDVSHCP